jgi:hypothetical protein
MRRVIVAVLVLVGVLVSSPVSPVVAAGCEESGVGCAVGMTGPRGGIIFYDAGSQQWWGRFLEAERTATRAASVWGASASIYGSSASVALQRQSMAIGMGRTNSERMRSASASLALTALATDQDWFIPSKDELDALYNYWRINRPAGIDYGQVPVWTSSESENTFAWYQLFHDGTQFTDANGIIPRLTTNKNYLKSARHVGSNFAPESMHIIRVRAFPSTGAQPPAPTLVTGPVNNPSCSSSAQGCRVGDVGPGGGIVVYDAGSRQSWGQYLEVAPKSCEISRVSYAAVGTGSLFPTAEARAQSKAIGAGEGNTRRLRLEGSLAFAANSAAQMCNNLNDWFLPSKDELNEAFRWLSHGRTGLQVTPVGQFERGYYWTSSDYNGQTAWTQYFADGQQFDRVQTLTGNKKPPARPFYVRPMRSFFEGLPSRSTSVAERLLMITGSRGTVNGKSGVLVDGISTGFSPGTVLKAWLKFPGESQYAQSSAQILVGSDGSFTWSRRTGKKTYVFVQAPDGARSNTVIISAN